VIQKRKLGPDADVAPRLQARHSGCRQVSVRVTERIVLDHQRHLQSGGTQSSE
jgi:hypothetical protein